MNFLIFLCWQFKTEQELIFNFFPKIWLPDISLTHGSIKAVTTIRVYAFLLLYGFYTGDLCAICTNFTIPSIYYNLIKLGLLYLSYLKLDLISNKWSLLLFRIATENDKCCSHHNLTFIYFNLLIYRKDSQNEISLMRPSNFIFMHESWLNTKLDWDFTGIWPDSSTEAVRTVNFGQWSFYSISWKADSTLKYYNMPETLRNACGALSLDGPYVCPGCIY